MLLKRFMWAGLAVLGLALVVGTGVSQDGKKFKGQLPAGWKKLELSKEQVFKIYSIQGKYKEKIRALEAQLKELKSQERGELVKVLSDEQKDKLRKLILPEEKKPAPSKEVKEKVG